MQALKVSEPRASGPSPIFEQVPCVLCGSQNFAIVREPAYPAEWEGRDFEKMYLSSSDIKLMDQLVECDTCRLAYLNPRPRKEVVLKGYSSAVDPVFISQNEDRIATFRRVLGKVVTRFGLTPSRDAKVLDVGCAGGAFPKAAHDAGYSVVGVEPSEWLSRYARETFDLDIRTGTLEQQRFEPGTFDLVTLWDVIEHVHDPVSVLKECRRVTKRGHHLIINFPDYGSLACKLFGKEWPFFLGVHLYYFTRATFAEALSQSGFEPLYWAPHWQTLKLSYVLERGSKHFGFLKWAQRLVDGLGIGNSPLTYNLGQTLCVAKAK